MMKFSSLFLETVWSYGAGEEDFSGLTDQQREAVTQAWSAVEREMKAFISKNGEEAFCDLPDDFFDEFALAYFDAFSEARSVDP